MISSSNILQRKKNQKDSVGFWCRKMTLKVQILQTLRSLFIIFVGLTMTWFSDKMLIFVICRRGLMPNMILKSWTGIYFSTYLHQKRSITGITVHFEKCLFLKLVRNRLATPNYLNLDFDCVSIDVGNVTIPWNFCLESFGFLLFR